jgi:hypothetical protein
MFIRNHNDYFSWFEINSKININIVYLKISQHSVGYQLVANTIAYMHNV